MSRRNVRKHNVLGQNVRRDKTSGVTKRPEGQNVRQTKDSTGQNVQRHNIRGTNRQWGHNVRKDYVSGRFVWALIKLFIYIAMFPYTAERRK